MPFIHPLDQSASGNTVLARLESEDAVHFHWGGATFSFVLFRPEQGGVRWLDHGRDGPLFDQVKQVHTMPFGRFAANLVHEGRKRFAINGELWPVPDSEVWLVNRDGVPLWTRGKSAEEDYPHTTWIGMRQQKHPYYGQSELGPDGRSFLYSSASWPDYFDFRFIWDGQVFFNGSLHDLTHNPDWKLLSWVGSPEDAETDVICLRGQSMDTGYEYIEQWSFDVCSEHRHFMFAVGTESMDEGVSMVVDGVMQPERYEHIQLWGNWFFNDPAHWFYCGVDFEERHHVVKDGQVVGVHAWADGYEELPGNRLAYLAEEEGPASGWSARVDDQVVARWPHALPRSMAANGRGDVAYVVDLEKRSDEQGWGRMALVVNHEPVWIFDRPVSYMPGEDWLRSSMVVFESDDLVRCLGVKDDALVMHTHVLSSSR